MTNYKQAAGNKPRGFNCADGPPSDRPQTAAAQCAADAKWIAAGFTRLWLRGAPRLAYTWAGEFPQFVLTPGFSTDDQGTRDGLVARCELADKELLFDYGIPPTDIAARLNSIIHEMMEWDAEVDEMPGDWRPESDEIDFDGFKDGEWTRS